MLYGWVNGNAERLTDDSEWASVGMDEDVYYLGNWDDGAMKTGWQYLYVYDEEEDEDMYHWFWFNSNGTRFQKNSDTKDNYRTKKSTAKDMASMSAALWHIHR